MSRFEEIRNFPRVVDNNHESIYRSYQILDMVRELLAAPEPTPRALIIELIDDLQNAPEPPVPATDERGE